MCDLYLDMVFYYEYFEVHEGTITMYACGCGVPPIRVVWAIGIMGTKETMGSVDPCLAKLSAISLPWMLLGAQIFGCVFCGWCWSLVV